MTKILLLLLLCSCDDREVIIEGAGGLEVRVKTSHTGPMRGGEVVVEIGPRPVYSVVLVPLLFPYPAARATYPSCPQSPLAERLPAIP